MKGRLDEPVTVVIPFSPAHTPDAKLQRALDSVDRQAVETAVNVVRDEEQRGAAWARNVGLCEADSRFVAFLDADDYWTDDKLARQLDRMAETGSGLCIEGSSMTRDTFFRELLVGSIGSVTSSILVDTEQVDVEFDESIERLEDHLFMVEAAAQSDVCFCKDLITVEKHDEGLSAHTTPELVFRSRRAIVEAIRTRIPEAQSVLDDFEMHTYYARGRQHHLHGEYEAAIPYLLDSLRVKLHYKPSLVLLICLVRGGLRHGVARFKTLFGRVD